MSLKDIRNNLNAFENRAFDRIEQSMDDIGKAVKEDAQNLTSIDTGDLFDSAFHQIKKQGDHIGVVIGYQEDYAAPVHDMPDNTNWQRAGAENEFLSKAVLKNMANLINTIVRRFKTLK